MGPSFLMLLNMVITVSSCSAWSLSKEPESGVIDLQLD